MEAARHPDSGVLTALAAGDPELAAGVADHVAGCEICAGRVAELRGVLEAAAEELLDMRPDCLSPEDLATIPPGGEWEHPHVRECPLCQEEIRLLYAFETQERLGVSLEDAPFLRPELFEPARSFAYLESEGPLELTLRPGASSEGQIAGATVRLRVVVQELVVEVEGEPAQELVLVLSDDVLEKRLPLPGATLNVNAGRWLRARLEVQAGPVTRL